VTLQNVLPCSPAGNTHAFVMYSVHAPSHGGLHNLGSYTAAVRWENLLRTSICFRGKIAKCQWSCKNHKHAWI